MFINCAECGLETKRLATPERKIRAFCNADCRSIFYGINKVERACGFCGNVYICNASNNQKLFCSKSCGAKARKNKIKVTRSCLICSESFLTAFDHQRFCSRRCRESNYYLKAYGSSEKPKTYTSTCAWCAESIVKDTPFYHPTHYHRDCAKKAERARYRLKTIKRQGASTGIRISVDELAERDGFICYLCNGQVDMTVPRLSPNGATVDHIVPISRGGLDTLENIKLTHWKCNRAKGAKLIEELNA